MSDTRDLDRAFGRGAFFMLAAVTLFAIVELLEGLVILCASTLVADQGGFEQLARIQVATRGGGLLLKVFLLFWAVRRPALPAKTPGWWLPVLLIIASALAGALAVVAHAGATATLLRRFPITAEAFGAYTMQIQILQAITTVAFGLLVAVAIALAYHRWRRA